MKSNKFISKALVLIAAVLMLIAMTSCGGNGSRTLEDYLAESEDAEKDLDMIARSMDEDQVTRDIQVSGNKITLTLKFTETYETAYLDTIKSTFEESLDAQESNIKKQLKSLEDKGDLSGVTLALFIENGDSSEIVSREFTA